MHRYAHRSSSWVLTILGFAVDNISKPPLSWIILAPVICGVSTLSFDIVDDDAAASNTLNRMQMKLFPLSTLFFQFNSWMNGSGNECEWARRWHELSTKHLRYLKRERDNPSCTCFAGGRIADEDLWHLIVIPRNVCNQIESWGRES